MRLFHFWPRHLALAMLFVFCLPAWSEESLSSCPLVDSGVHADLFSAIAQLRKEIEIIPECQDQESLKNIGRVSDDLRASVERLQGYWLDPRSAADNLTAFNQQLTTAIQAVSQIGSALDSNALLNSRCGRELMSSGRALVAFSDIVTSVAPFALLAGTLSSGLSVAIPYVVGVVGFASTFKIIANMVETATLDMRRYEHRQAVLRNTCEFAKVAQRIRYMKLAQSGQTQSLQDEIQALENQIERSMDIQSADLRSSVQSWYQSRNSAIEIEQGIQRDRSHLYNLRLSLGESPPAWVLCSSARSLLDLNPHSQRFPHSIIFRANRLIEIDRDFDSPILQSLFSQERFLKTQLQESFAATGEESLLRCAELSEAWIHVLQQIFRVSEQRSQGLVGRLESQYERDPEFRRWNRQTSSVQREYSLLQHLKATIDQLQLDETLISRSELHQRVEALRSALFGIRGSWSLGSSPVLAWLNHTLHLHSRSLGSFRSGVAALTKEIYLSDFERGIEENIFDLPEWNPNDLGEALRRLDHKKLPIGGYGHQKACRLLELSWLDWAASQDHLRAAALFCRNIEPMIDNQVERGIVDHCQGDRSLFGFIRRASSIEDRQEYLSRMGLSQKANLISQQMRKMSCPEPQALAM